MVILFKQNRKRKGAGGMGYRSVFPASYDDGLLTLDDWWISPCPNEIQWNEEWNGGRCIDMEVDDGRDGSSMFMSSSYLVVNESDRFVFIIAFNF